MKMQQHWTLHNEYGSTFADVFRRVDFPLAEVEGETFRGYVTTEKAEEIVDDAEAAGDVWQQAWFE